MVSSLIFRRRLIFLCVFASFCMGLIFCASLPRSYISSAIVSFYPLFIADTSKHVCVNKLYPRDFIDDIINELEQGRGNYYLAGKSIENFRSLGGLNGDGRVVSVSRLGSNDALVTLNMATSDQADLAFNQLLMEIRDSVSGELDTLSRYFGDCVQSMDYLGVTRNALGLMVAEDPTNLSLAKYGNLILGHDSPSFVELAVADVRIARLTILKRDNIFPDAREYARISVLFALVGLFTSVVWCFLRVLAFGSIDSRS
jgi:hypothetical protein